MEVGLSRVSLGLPGSFLIIYIEGRAPGKSEHSVQDVFKKTRVWPRDWAGLRKGTPHKSCCFVEAKQKILPGFGAGLAGFTPQKCPFRTRRLEKGAGLAAEWAGFGAGLRERSLAWAWVGLGM